MRKNRHRELLLVLPACWAAGCATNPGGGGSDGGSEPSTVTLRLTLEGVEPLGEGFEYEGWLIVDGAPVSTGKFGVVADGQLSTTDFDVSQSDADSATTFVLTIEPVENDPPEPADTHLLAGDLADDAADLTVGHGAALGSDFATAAGTFILNTPSTADTDDDFDQGIWWLTITEGGPAVSLELPELPAGWVYEGWVAGADGPISTGRFSMADAADDDGAGATSGPDDFPPFPGQDFIDPAMVLTAGFAAVISVEPDPDDAAAPFAIKPLVDADIEDVGIGVDQSMGNSAATNPTGSVEFIRG